MYGSMHTYRISRHGCTLHNACMNYSHADINHPHSILHSPPRCWRAASCLNVHSRTGLPMPSPPSCLDPDLVLPAAPVAPAAVASFLLLLAFCFLLFAKMSFISSFAARFLLTALPDVPAPALAAPGVEPAAALASGGAALAAAPGLAWPNCFCGCWRPSAAAAGRPDVLGPSLGAPAAMGPADEPFFLPMRGQTQARRLCWRYSDVTRESVGQCYWFIGAGMRQSRRACLPCCCCSASLHLVSHLPLCKLYECFR